MSNVPIEYPHYDDDEWNDDDEWAEAEMNCGRMNGGQCSQAGTEYCDFGCPFR